MDWCPEKPFTSKSSFHCQVTNNKTQYFHKLKTEIGKTHDSLKK